MNCEYRPDIKIYCDVLTSRRILVYPSSGAGALNIMKSDVKRLNPMCYLNDTLIEFGLKYVHYNWACPPLTYLNQALAR